MADFTEKDNEVKTGGDISESSTVFSDPASHNPVKVKGKKTWTRILTAAVILAVLASGTFAVIKLIPVLEQENTVYYEEIPLKNIDSDSVSAVTVTKGGDITRFYSEETKEGDEVTSTDWYIESIDKELTSSTEISNVVDAVSVINASREITEKSEKECGLDAPAIEVKVEVRDADGYEIFLGGASPDNSGYYCSISGQDGIYVVSNDMWNALDFDVLDFADLSVIPGFENEDGELDEYFSNGQLAEFDKLTVKGDNFPEPVEIIRNTDEELSDYLGYIVMSPSERIAQNTESILILYQTGMEVTGAYSYDVGEESLKKFGLDTPDLELTMYAGNKSLTYKFALQEDGSYAVVYDDSKIIHQVDAYNLDGIIDLTTTDFYSTWICYISINDLSNFTIKTDNKDYSFDIVKNETDEEDSESGEEEDYTVTTGGKKLVALNFQYLYQYCVTLKCNDFTVEDTSAEPSVTFIFKFKEGGESVIEFTKVSATKYQYSVDGIKMGRVSVSSIDKVIENAEKVSNGETISQLA